MEDEYRHEGFFLWIILRIIFAVVIISLVFRFAFSFTFGQPMMLYHDWFWSLIGILALIWIVSWIFRWPFHYRHWNEREIRILRRRYARGDITEAQFKRMMKNLREQDKRRS